MKALRLLLPALAVIAAKGASPPAPALGDHEELDYHVSWMIVPGAGEIKIAAYPATDPSGAPLQRVVTETSTRGLARLLLPFEARSESLFSVLTGRLLWLGESSATRGAHRAHTVSFDYSRGVANYADGEHPRELALPPGYPSDLITCLVQSRTWNLKPGETHDALVLFENDFYELTVHAIGYQTLTTPLGDFETLILEPRMEKTPKKGMFKHGSTVRVWVSTDARRLPVRFRVDFKFGTGVATLVKVVSGVPPGDRK